MALNIKFSTIHDSLSDIYEIYNRIKRSRSMPAIRSPTIMQFCTNYYVYESIEQHISPHFKRTNLSTYMNSCPCLELTLRAHLSLLVLTSLTPSTPIIDKHYSLYYSISKDKFLPILHSPSIRHTKQQHHHHRHISLSLLPQHIT